MSTLIKKKPKLSREFLKKEYLLSRGRIALLWALRLLKLDKKKKILLPSYIGISKKEGSGVFDPIRKLGVGYEFYKLNSDLSANLEDFAKKIKQPDIKAALVIHYFGFWQKNFDYLLKICRNNKKYLIEDCAQTFNSFYHQKRLGSYGDIGFYSIHKFLPTNDGGILLINNDSIKIPENLKDKISHRTLMILQKSDLEQISKVMRENYLYLLKRIKQIKGLRVFYDQFPKGIVPLNFPVLIEKKDRNEIYFKLLERRIETVSLYYQIIPQIKKEEYPLSYYISNHILNLPIHQDITKSNINTMLKELKNILKKMKMIKWESTN